MSKIFRLYKEGIRTYQDWNETSIFPYNDTNREQIEDPEGASAHNEITSIPSPFARIDLVKTAYAEVCKKNDLNGNTIFHKMVSDSLDIGEIFFKRDKFKDKIEIITWNPQNMINELQNSAILGHQYYGDVLLKFLRSDTAYNFNRLQNLYLLNYIGKDAPEQLNIIGSTSPSTLFFSSSNNLDYVTNNINFGRDRPFDNDFQPLYRRDFEYIKALFVLRASISNFASLFPEFNDYLDLTYKAIETEKKNLLKEDAYVANYDYISVDTSDQNDHVEVLGIPLLGLKRKLFKESDFKIKPTRQTDCFPLVLPVKSGNEYQDLIYTTDKWGNTNAAPFKAEEDDYKKRILPFDGNKQPYLTISDFLEDYLIRVPHKLNTNFYYNGNIELDSDAQYSYLLPIKNLFFTFFSPDDLLNSPIEKNMIDMETLSGGSVKVYMRIPINGRERIRYIEYMRIYYKDREANILRNEGGIVESDFSAFIMPIIKFQNDEEAFYRISNIGVYSNKINFKFFKNGIQLNDIKHDCRNKSKLEEFKAETYIVDKCFDYIQINSQEYSGIILPKFKKQSGSDSFKFAVDLGTSNTHIEYTINNDFKETIPFRYGEDDKQTCDLFLPSITYHNGEKLQKDLKEELLLEENDFLPQQFGIGNDYFFPSRTILSYAKDINWDNRIDPFGLVNIPFTFDKKEQQRYNKIESNVKWGLDHKEQSIIEAYIGCLMLMIRNKVLLNGGALNLTQLTWFYPISMPPKRLELFRNIWNEKFKIYFGTQGTTSITESVAPIQYFYRLYDTATNLVTIDIGGGTTDIAFASDGKVENVTSFRFAANSIFENGFSDINSHNGIVDCYKNNIYKILEDNEIPELPQLLKGHDTNPANMASFLFLLKNNSEIKELDPKCIDFNYILRMDDDFKIVFILFYTSIIYHIAQIIKAKAMKMPRHLAFSGNGSNVIKIITTDMNILSNYTKQIFETVIGRKYETDLELLGLDAKSTPKEATCKGGLLCREDDKDIHNKIIILKAYDNSFVKIEDSYDSINDEYIKKVADSLKEFYNFIFEKMDKAFDFDANFGVSKESMSIAKSLCKKDIETFINKGIMQRKKESDGKDKIEETFFFYPIKGLINALSQEIYTKLKLKK